MGMDSRLLEISQQARRGELQSALLALRDYVKAYPEDVDAWVVLGSIAPDSRIRLSALRRALQLDPENIVAQRALEELATIKDAAPDFSEPAGGAFEAKPLDLLAFVPEPTENLSSFSAADALMEQTASSDLDLPPDSVDESDLEVEDDADNAADAFQSVRDARAQVWPFVPRSEDKRTLGELLDERRLTRQDLLWASEKAQEVEVRDAAGVILANVHRLPDVGMSQEDARLVSWPFRRLNRPLGELVDAGVVKLKDLRRASWFAQDARVREAARLMLPLANRRQKRLKRQRKPQEVQPPEDANPVPTPGVRHHAVPRSRARPMPIIEGANYLVSEIQRRVRQQVLIAWVAMFFMFAGVLVALFDLARRFLLHQVTPLWAWLLMGVFILPLFWLSERMVELRIEEQTFRKGQQGEVLVARNLRQGLGGDWMLFRNVKLPGSDADIDMVLLGPPGVFALEVKAYSGAYLYRRDRFYRRSVMGWRTMHHNPSKQARAGAASLHQYISLTLNRDIWVEPRLVWGGLGSLTLDSPQIFVWYLDRLDYETERLRSLPVTLSDEDRAMFSGLLRGLCSALR